MFRRLQRTGIMWQLIVLSVLPLALTGTGYALFSQNLHINASATKPSYSSNQNLFLTYTTTETTSKNGINYSLNPISVTNKGTIAVSSWQAAFDIPSDASHITCSASVTCKNSGSTITVTSGAANSALPTGATVDFTLSFSSAIAKYTLQNVYIGGTYAATYGPTQGLSITINKGTPTQRGAHYSYPYTFTVANNSTKTVFTWQITCAWSRQPSGVSIDPAVNYTSDSNNIIITGSDTLSPGNSTSFNGLFTVKSSTWAIDSCTVLGGA